MQTGKAADPFAVLEVDERANDAQIREAYLRGVRLHPPDRDADGFRRVREAFEAIADRRKRAERRLFGGPAPAALEDLAGDDQPGTLRHVGPAPWLAVLRSATPQGGKEEQR